MMRLAEMANGSYNDVPQTTDQRKRRDDAEGRCNNQPVVCCYSSMCMVLSESNGWKFLLVQHNYQLYMGHS